MQSLAKQLIFFSGKRVLITGDTGFKGSWLAIWLHSLGAKVLGYALPPESKESHFALTGLDSLITHVKGDIRDAQRFRKVVQKFQPEILFHLAAQSLVRVAYKEPKITFDTNIGGSVNVLETIRLTPTIRSVVYITSDKCYKNKEWVWGYRENDELGGYDPYSASKAAAEIVFSAYLNSFFKSSKDIGIASTRAGNVIGGGDWASDRIIPDCIRSLQKKQPIVLRSPEATRPWQHVLEPLWGYLLLAIRLWESPTLFLGSWNFGPKSGKAWTVLELVERVIQCWGEGEYRIEPEKNSPHEARLLHLNTDKANIELNWGMHWETSQAITETVDWYKRVFHGEQVINVTRSQIEKFSGGKT